VLSLVILTRIMSAGVKFAFAKPMNARACWIPCDSAQPASQRGSRQQFTRRSPTLTGKLLLNGLVTP